MRNVATVATLATGGATAGPLGRQCPFRVPCWRPACGTGALGYRGRLTADCRRADTLLVREAVRNAGGLREPAAPFAAAPPMLLPSAADFSGPQSAIPGGAVDVVRVNGRALNNSGLQWVFQVTVSKN